MEQNNRLDIKSLRKGDYVYDKMLKQVYVCTTDPYVHHKREVGWCIDMLLHGKKSRNVNRKTLVYSLTEYFIKVYGPDAVKVLFGEK